MTADIIQTELGTRVLVLEGGGCLVVTKHEAENTFLTARDHFGLEATTIKLSLTQSEVLQLIEQLAIAARVGTGRAIVEAPKEMTP